MLRFVHSPCSVKHKKIICVGPEMEIQREKQTDILFMWSHFVWFDDGILCDNVVASALPQSLPW